MATHSSVLAWRIPGTGSLVGCSLWGHTESDTTEVMQQQQQIMQKPLREKKGLSLHLPFCPIWGPQEMSGNGMCQPSRGVCVWVSQANSGQTHG